MQRFRIALAVLITVVWLGGYVAAYITHGQNPTELSGLMAIVLGWAFAGQLRETARQRAKQFLKDKEDKDE